MVSQVAKHPSLYWRAMASSTAGTTIRSATRIICVKNLRSPSAMPAVFMAVRAGAASHSAAVTSRGSTA